MDKRTKAEIIALGAAACLGAGYIYALAPGKSTREQRAPFRGRYFAHRGLYDGEKRPENSLAAFRAAAECGYGAELDVRLTADDVAVISHDSHLLRMTGKDEVVEELNRNYAAFLRSAGREARRLPWRKRVESFSQLCREAEEAHGSAFRDGFRA